MSHPDPRLGTIVGGKYRIARFLAEGGMGTVYEAQQVVVKRRLAIKFLRPELLQRRDVLARFKLEAESAGSLESENIAAALDFGVTNDGAPYLVMEYLDGVSLAGLLRSEGPLPLERAADLVAQACAGIQRAHDAGVLHRDLKPQNLFVCRRSDGTDLVKIVDFGVAKLLDGDAASGVTATGGMVGTPSYLSPEQARGEAAIDRRVDVYALGVILYELLAGHPPHPGDSYNAVIHHISTQPPLPLEPRAGALPAALIEIVARTLASQPEQRPASAAELARALEEFGRRRAWQAPRADASPGFDATLLAERAPAPRGGLEDAASAVPLDNSGVRAARRTSWLWLAGMGLLASVAILIAVLWPGQHAAAPSAGAVSAAPVVAALAPAPPPESVRTRPADVPAPEANREPPVRPSASAAVLEPAVSDPAPKRKVASTARSAPPPRPMPRAAAQPKRAAEFDNQNPY